MVPASCGNSHYKRVVFKWQGDNDTQPFPLVRLYSFCFNFGTRIHQFAASWVQKSSVASLLAMLCFQRTKKKSNTERGLWLWSYDSHPSSPFSFSFIWSAVYLQIWKLRTRQDPLQCMEHAAWLLGGGEGCLEGTGVVGIVWWAGYSLYFLYLLDGGLCIRKCILVCYFCPLQPSLWADRIIVLTVQHDNENNNNKRTKRVWIVAQWPSLSDGSN